MTRREVPSYPPLPQFDPERDGSPYRWIIARAPQIRAERSALHMAVAAARESQRWFDRLDRRQEADAICIRHIPAAKLPEELAKGRAGVARFKPTLSAAEGETQGILASALRPARQQADESQEAVG